jgi:hypothetical protein
MGQVDDCRLVEIRIGSAMAYAFKMSNGPSL